MYGIDLIVLSIAILVFLLVSVYKSWSNTEEIKKELREIKELLKQKDNKNWNVRQWGWFYLNSVD